METFVAVGDSFTEGLHDGPGPDGVYRGWADRVAEALAQRWPDLGYANLAVRGKLLHEVVANQVPVATSMAPDLLAFHAGGNDALRPGVDLDRLVERYADAVAEVAAASGQVLLFTLVERSGDGGRMADRLAERIAHVNEGIRGVADRHGALLVDVARATVFRDRRLWHEDRLHLAAHGHERIAAAVLDRLGVDVGPGDPGWWRRPLPPAPGKGRAAVMVEEARWIRRHLLPWVGRRVRGVSSGDGVTAKRPDLAPVGRDS